MRTIRRYVLVVLLVAASLGVSVTPAAAEDSAWGYYNYPIVLHPGSTGSVGFISSIGIAPETRWEAVGSARPEDLERAQLQLVEPITNCLLGPRFTVTVLDRLGVRRSTMGPGAGFTVLPTARTGPHWVRVTCTQPNTTPADVVACVRFDIDPARGVEHFVGTDDPMLSRVLLRRDPCPSIGRILGSLVGDLFARLIMPRFSAAPPGESEGPDASPATTTTTTRPSGKPAAEPAPQGDPVAPVVHSVNLTGSTYCQPVHVSASASDDVGVTSATVSWSGLPGSGSMAMSGGGTSWSAVISPPAGFANPGVLNVTVTARDAAGNPGTGSSSIELTLC